MLPLVQRPGVRLRVLTRLERQVFRDGASDLDAIALLRNLPNCQVRGAAHLGARVYLRTFLRSGGEEVAPETAVALITSATLTGAGLDANLEFGLRLAGSGAAAVAAEVERWWQEATPLTAATWAELEKQVRTGTDLRRLSDEILRLGSFIKVSMRGTRRTRRLDPREYGLENTPRTLRPVEVELYTFPEVVRAREELERVLLEHGVEWGGYFLVPREFADYQWPRIFAARERALQQWAHSEEGRRAVAEMLRRAQQDLEGWFLGLYDQLTFAGKQPQEPRDLYARYQAERLLAEQDVADPLAQIGLEYRSLHIVPEDPRSLEELRAVLDHPKFRSLQLMWRL